MCLNNFRHDLSTILMTQTFEGFNDLCTKTHDKELHLTKRKKPAKESAMVGNYMVAMFNDLSNSPEAFTHSEKESFYTEHES